MNEFVLNGLVKRRAELADDIENPHEALRKMVLDLESLDATIVQFDPDFQVKTIKPKAFRPPKDWSNRGPTMFVRIGVLRALNRKVERVFNPDRNDTQRVSQFERKASKA